MSTLLKKISIIDQRTKYGVYGWIRKAEKELMSGYIPVMISNICLMYYFEEEIFEIIGKDVMVSEDKRCITKMNSTSWSNASYGINEIESNTCYTYQWNLKIRHKTINSTMIGISNSIHPNKYFRCYSMDKIASKPVFYVLWSGSGQLYNNDKHGWDFGGIQFKEGDIISLILDLSKQEISAKVNDDKKRVVYRDIAKSDDIKYRLMVSLCEPDTCVEIIDFKTNNV